MEAIEILGLFGMFALIAGLTFLITYRKDPMTEYYKYQTWLLRNPQPKTESQKAYEKFMDSINELKYPDFNKRNWACDETDLFTLKLLEKLKTPPEDEAHNPNSATSNSDGS